MTKVELIAAVANDANLTKKDAEAEGRRQGHAGRLWHL